MSKSEKESPRSAEHLEAQRNRILDASEACFIEHGFHAASMARIAKTAGISQGLAYRYFKNKSAIILAIIERQLARRHSLLDSSDEAGSFARHILQLVDSWANGGEKKMNPVLFMEMCSEASRDPDIREAMATADSTYLGDFKGWMRMSAEALGKKISEQEIDKRFFTLQAIIEGAAMLASRRRRDQNLTSNEVFFNALKQIVTID